MTTESKEMGTSSGEEPAASSSAEAAQLKKLHHSALSGIGVLAQSVGSIAPSASVGAALVLVIELTGPASWVTWVIGGAVLIIVAYVLTQLTSRFETSGGLYAMAARAGGASFGYVIAWMAFVCYMATAVAVTYQIAEFLGGFLALPAIGIPYNDFTGLVIGLLGIGFGGYCSYYNVKLSARVMLVLEALSMLAITVLMLMILLKHNGSIFNSHELTFNGGSWHAILLGMPLVMFCYSGFESSSVLGQEARNPRRTISVALIGSVAVSAVFFTICSYVLVLAFQGTHFNFTTTSNLLASAANVSNVGWYGYVVDVGIILSMIAVIIAYFNVGSRLLFTLSNEGLLPRPLSRVHPKHGTPSVAVWVVALTCGGSIILVAAMKANMINAFGNFGTVAGDGAIFMYLLTAVAVIGMVARRRFGSAGSNAPAVLVASLIAVAGLAYLLYKSFVPYPSFPLNVFVDAFIAATGIAIVLLVVMVVRKSPLLRQTGSSCEVEDEESTIGELT